jgi:hypothetical protein
MRITKGKPFCPGKLMAMYACNLKNDMVRPALSNFSLQKSV